MEDLNVQTIAIPVEEYKELIQKQAELSLIYHKGAGGSVYHRKRQTEKVAVRHGGHGSHSGGTCENYDVSYGKLRRYQ